MLCELGRFVEYLSRKLRVVGLSREPQKRCCLANEIVLTQHLAYPRKIGRRSGGAILHADRETVSE